MGEMADAIIDGECCQECGQFFEEEYGYPISCTECDGEGILIGGEDDQN